MMPPTIEKVSAKASWWAAVMIGILAPATLLLAPVWVTAVASHPKSAGAWADAPLVTPTSTATSTPTPTASATPTVDIASAIPIACGQSATGDTRGASNNVSTYGCVPWWPETGPEKVYALTLAGSQTVDAVLSGAVADLDLFVLTSANPSSCIAYGDNSAHLSNLSPGLYYIVIDGLDGAAGAYRLDVWCPLVLTPTVTPTATRSPTATPANALRRIYLPAMLKR